MSIELDRSVSAYMDRMEKAFIEIQEERNPLDHTQVLWWGLDGLRLNDDGTLEWISRKKELPPAYCTSHSMATIPYSYPLFAGTNCSETCCLADMRSEMDKLRMQTACATQTAILQAIVSQCQSVHFWR